METDWVTDNLIYVKHMKNNWNLYSSKFMIYGFSKKIEEIL